MREGIGADAPMSIYGECVQADLKIPFKSKRLRLTRLGELAAKRTEGSYYRYKSEMRLTDGTISGYMKKCGA